MNLYGLIGYPLEHSFSPDYFQNKFRQEKIENAAYKLFPLENIKEFPDLLESNRNIKGLNVTIPYKEAIIPYLDELDPVASEIGAVNTIVFKNNKTIGYNTDVYGFESSLRSMIKPHHSKSLILGNGGAAKAIKHVLAKLGIHYTIVSRSPNEHEIDYASINESLLDTHTLIINTTPVGMYPDVDSCPPIPWQHLTSRHFLFDLVYNPSKTKFLKQGEEHGCAIKNGLEMLEKQAERSWVIWNK